MPAHRTTAPNESASTANIGFEAKLRLAAEIHHLASHGMADFVLAKGRKATHSWVNCTFS